MEEIATRLSDLLASHNMTQRELANAIGISNGTISRIISGDVIPNCYTIIKIADFFTVTTDYLLGRES